LPPPNTFADRLSGPECVSRYVIAPTVPLVARGSPTAANSTIANALIVAGDGIVAVTTGYVVPVSVSTAG